MGTNWTWQSSPNCCELFYQTSLLTGFLIQHIILMDFKVVFENASTKLFQHITLHKKCSTSNCFLLVHSSSSFSYYCSSEFIAHPRSQYSSCIVYTSSSLLLFFSVHSSPSFSEGNHCAVLPEPSELEREGCNLPDPAHTFRNVGIPNHFPALHFLPVPEGG